MCTVGGRGVLHWLLMAGLAVAASSALAQEEKGEATQATPAAEPAKPAEQHPAEAAAAAAALPPYSTGTNPPEPAPALWPDPTGVNAGDWASPSAGPIGDGDPARRTIPALYNRIVHNLFSINIVWAMVTGFLVMFMQAGFAMVEMRSQKSIGRRNYSGIADFGRYNRPGERAGWRPAQRCNPTLRTIGPGILSTICRCAILALRISNRESAESFAFFDAGSRRGGAATAC